MLFFLAQMCLAVSHCPIDAAAYANKLIFFIMCYVSSAKTVAFETECIECCVLPVGAHAWLACMRHCCCSVM
jgi:hypothetical protein